MPARRTTKFLAAGLLPLALTACGVGLDPRTYQPRTLPDATNAQAGELALRNVAIQPPATGEAELAVGQDALLTLTIVNPGRAKDTLTAVSSPAASATRLVDGSGRELPSVDVPAGGEPADYRVVLVGLTRPLRPGGYVDVTFAFATNGRLKVSVPVKLYGEPVPRASFAPKELAE